MGSNTIRPTVEFCGMWTQSKGWQITSLKLQSNVQSLEMQFDWPWAAETSLRSDLLDFVKGLAARLCTYDRENMPRVELPRFNAALPGLNFENLAWHRSMAGRCKLSLVLAQGGIEDLFSTLSEKNDANAVEEVFLPLTNLAAYLRAMSVGDTSNGTTQALTATAERIDEFLLLYGNKLRDDPLVPLQSFSA